MLHISYSVCMVQKNMKVIGNLAADKVIALINSLLIWPLGHLELSFVDCSKMKYWLRLTQRHSAVVSVLSSINVVNRHWARLVLGWVTICGWVNYLGM